MRQVLTPALLGARFLLELGLLATAGWLGWNLGSGGVAGALLAAAVAVAVATLWGVLLSPKARVTVPFPMRLLVEVVLFCAAGLGLWLTGLQTWALVLVAGEVVVLLSLLALGERPGPADR